jgi:tRNA-binding protein
MTLAADEFARVDIRVGTIVAAEPFPEARRPAYKLSIDFGLPLGVRSSSAQLTRHYTPEALVGRQIAAVVNVAPRRIGPFLSEVLVLGFPDAEGAVVLIAPDRPVPDGGAVSRSSNDRRRPYPTFSKRAPAAFRRRNSARSR